MTSLDNLPLREELRGLTPYGAPQLDVAVRLNTNENAHRLPVEVVTAMTAALAAVVPDLNRYPDRDALALRADLAAYLQQSAGPVDVSAANVWAANGSNEIQQQVLQAFGGPGRTALGFTPSYSMHPLLAAGTGTAWRDGQRAGDFELSAESAVEQVGACSPDVVFLCSPNNPTGTRLSIEVIRAVADAADGMVVVDEAYAEFARPGGTSALTLLREYPRLIVTRTMSKAFALAGARLGYLVAAPAVIDAVQLVRLPYHLSALTQAAARAALAHAPALLGTVEEIKAERDRIVTCLRDWGLTVADSDANFVLFAVRGGDAATTWRELLDRGVLVRDVGLRRWLRVTAGTRAETDAFLAAMKDLLSRMSGVQDLP